MKVPSIWITRGKNSRLPAAQTAAQLLHLAPFVAPSILRKRWLCTGLIRSRESRGNRERWGRVMRVEGGELTDEHNSIRGVRNTRGGGPVLGCSSVGNTGLASGWLTLLALIGLRRMKI